MGLGAVQEGNDLHLAAIANDLVFRAFLLFLIPLPPDRPPHRPLQDLCISVTSGFEGQDESGAVNSASVFFFFFASFSASVKIFFSSTSVL